MLTERQELILKTIITDFTQSHEPVGSKTVMKQLPIKVSSATIRNEMAVLEEQGLIEKTHSSSGRIPSSEGYRYYLDNLVEPLQLPESVYNTIGSQLDRPFHQVNEIVQEAARILSDLTNYTAFAEGPESHDVRVTGFRIVPLSQRQIMAILVTSDGNIQNQVYALPHNIHGEEIEKAVRMINDQLVGKSLNEINVSLLSELAKNELGGEHVTELLSLVEDVVKDAASEQMYVDGQINLLNNTSEHDVNDIRSLYELIDHNNLFTNLMDAQRQFHDDLKNELESGCIEKWREKSQFAEEETAESYECYLDGEYCENHFYLSIEKRPLPLAPEFIRTVAAAYEDECAREDFLDKAQALPEYLALTEDQKKQLLHNADIKGRISHYLDLCDTYWECYWDAVSKAEQDILQDDQQASSQK